MNNKTTTRIFYKQVIRTMNPAIVARKSKIITDKIEDIISYLPRPIAFFYPQAGEPDIKKLFSNYWQHQKAILLPKIENKEMFFYQINNINMLTYNSRFKLWEPCSIYLQKSCHLKTIFIPMVAFDNNNHRIGKGGGYYDRYLQNNISAIRIGIAFQEQKMINLIPNNRFDKKINFFITD